jgi:Esterase-like activity of phytase/Secretion system C-terminal sorting domain
MAKQATFLLLVFLLTSLAAHAQIARQGFEGTASDTWSFTATPNKYNVTVDEDFWTDTTVTPQIAPFADGRFWFMRDLDNPNGGFNGFHTLDFQAIDITGQNAGQVSFAYWTTEFEPADSLGYIIAFDNGTDWNMANYIDLDRNTGAWAVVQYPIPPGSTHVRLRLMAKQNGGSDWAGFDEVQIEAGLPPAVIAFDKKSSYVKEGTATASVKLNITNSNTNPSSVNVKILSASSALVGVDHGYTETTVTFPASATTSINVDVPITDDTAEDGGTYLILELGDFVNAEAGSQTQHILLIADNDLPVPAAKADAIASLRYVTSIDADTTAGNSAEIIAYDKASKRLYALNSIQNRLAIWNFTDPSLPTYFKNVDLAPYGAGGNSVAVYNGTVACAVQGSTTADNGKVVFFNANGDFLSSVNVGNLPDMVIFTPDGTKAITANEGEPSDDYLTDPEGSVSVIDLAPGAANLTDANVTTINFNAYDGQIASLRASGVRIFGPNASVSQDLEPEYVCLSPDGQSILVTCQENNAVVSINLATLQITGILPLGTIDRSLIGNALDASDRSLNTYFAKWDNLVGMYQPDAIECFTVGGTTYAISANEGDARAYTGFSEEVRVSNLTLDPTAFPNASFLKKDELLGRLRCTNATGDTDGDGDIDKIHAFGGRSFSIWNVGTGALVWDSGDDLEQITAADPIYGPVFNANGTSNTRKDRSDDKGPEPEGVAIGTIEGVTYGFIALERIGGVAMYDLSDPASPKFVQYINNRSTSGTAVTGDIGPEGLKFIAKADSPNGRDLLVVANEVSGTLTIYEVKIDRTKNGEYSLETFDYSPTTQITQWNGQPIFDGGISGLHYIPGTDKEFFAVSDRGPNADAGSHPNATGTTLLFPEPDYAPVITRFKAENGAWTVQSIEEIKRPGGTPITGLPLPTGAGNTGEIAWSDTIPTVLTPDPWGMDSEGILEDNFGNLWLCDEYGSSVWKLNKATKQVIKRYTPFPTLPEDVALPAAIGKRRPNRGFEGIALTPNGKIYTVLQSPANNPTAAVGNASRLTRIVEINPETDAVQMFAYEMLPTTGQIRTRDWKVGDMVAINNNELLLVEHGERNGTNSKIIYKVNISNATPLTTEDYNGQTYEQLNTAANAAAFGIVPVQKTAMFDLIEAGWDLTHDKPEGLSILDDTHIAVVNDNDFGINSPAADGDIVFTGKTTRLYVYSLPQPLGYVSPYCSYAAPVASASGCDGETVTLDAGSGFAGYQWSNGSTGQTAGVTAEGNYKVTVTNDVGCKAIDSIFVNINPASVFNLSQTLCPGSSLTVNGTVYDESNPTGTEILQGANVNGCDSVINVQLAFYPVATGAISASICQGETYAYNGQSLTGPGSFTFVFNSVNGCDSTVTVTLKVLPAPMPSLGNDQTICEGQFTTLDAGAGFASYLWNNGATTQTIQATTAGTYSVIVTHAINVCDGFDALTLTVNPAPSVSLGDNQTICEGESATLTAGAGFSSYAWSTGATGQSIQVTQTGTYSVVVSNSFGCTNLDAATVFVNPAPDVDLGPDTIVYEPNSYVLDAGAGFNQTYLWSNGATSQTITAAANGTYSVVVTSASGCTSTDEVTVSIEPNAVSDKLLSGKLNLFPNPTSGWVNLAFSEFETGAYNIGVYDVTGRLLLSQNLDIQVASQTAQLDLNHFPKGAYLVKIGSEKGMMARRVVVQ